MLVVFYKYQTAKSILPIDMKINPLKLLVTFVVQNVLLHIILNVEVNMEINGRNIIY